MFWNEVYQPENQRQAKLLGKLAATRKVVKDMERERAHLAKTLNFQRAQGHRGYYVDDTSRKLERARMYLPFAARQYDDAERQVYEYNKSRGVSYI